MVVVFGKVTDSPQTVGTSLSKDDCFDECFSTLDCILAYFTSDETCSLYNYTTTQTLTVAETNREDGCYVAFKTSMPSDSCPAIPDLINLTVTVIDDTYYWTRTESGWYFKKCIDDWKLFHRNNSVSVCMQSFNMTYGSTLEQAKKLCQDKGHVLSGLATIEECKWAYGNVQELSDGGYDGFWIDGKRTCPEENCELRKNSSSCNSFAWTDGFTSVNNVESETYQNNMEISFCTSGIVEDCLVITQRWGQWILNDVCCDGSVYTKALGAVCGYKFN